MLLLILWTVGVVSAFTFGGFIHILLAAAVILLVISLIRGRRAA